MKCKNCGWPNRPGEKNCAKCGTPLAADSTPASPANAGHNPTVVNTVPGAPTPDQRPAGPGLPNMFGQPKPAPQPRPQPRPVAPANPNVCPRCNYPLRAGMTECPNCLYQLAPALRPAPRPVNPAVAPIPHGAPVPAAFTPEAAPAKPAAPQQDAAPQQQQQQRQPNLQAAGHHRPTVVGLPEVNISEPQAPQTKPGGMEAPAPGARYRGTVNVYTAAAPETTPKFTLSPVQKVNEPEAPATLKFEGQEAILNRANTDPENLSITSRQQASISKRDGKWVITDLSDQQTTFIHPAKGHELHDGDMILLGNRLFIFHE